MANNRLQKSSPISQSNTPTFVEEFPHFIFKMDPSLVMWAGNMVVIGRMLVKGSLFVTAK